MEKLTSLGLKSLNINKPLVKNIATKVVGNLSLSISSNFSANLMNRKSVKKSFNEATNWKNLTMAGISGVAEGLYTTYEINTNNAKDDPSESSSSNPAEQLQPQPMQQLDAQQPSLPLPASLPIPNLPALPEPSFNSGYFEHFFDDVKGDYWKWVNN